MLAGILLITGFLIVWWALYCYVLYRIVRKFDSSVSYLEMLVPFWGFYRVIKTAFDRPTADYYFWGSIILLILLFNFGYPEDRVFKLASDLLYTLIANVPMILIAQKLGKNIWLYSILLLVVPAIVMMFPLVYYTIGFLVCMTVLIKIGFDSSKPFSQLTEEIPDKTI